MLCRKSDLKHVFCNIPTAIIIALLFSNAIFAGILYNQINVSNEYLNEIEEKDVKLKKSMNLREEEIKTKSIKYYAQQLQKLMSERELVFLAQKHWEYILTLNGNKLKQNTIYINEDSARIVLAEMVLDRGILPKGILEKGTVTGADRNDPLQGHLSLYTNIPYTTRIEENSQGRKVIYGLKKIPEGTVISLKMSPLLAERLGIGMEDQQLERRIEIIRK
ncbi:MAG: hypothetical protein FH758_06065 [Firmicutes bacterium]|nr:hypothetical protein [Bacillota bacterium]